MAAGTTYWAAPKQLNLEGYVSENYRKFDEHWALFEKTELKGKSEEERCSYFLLGIGEKRPEVHQTLIFPTPETDAGEGGTLAWKRTTQQLRTAFIQYCNPRKISHTSDTSLAFENKPKMRRSINT
jgi:hypothetical protein